MALVLSRKVGEQITIGENITVEITAINGSKITLAITAPQEVVVLRGEVKERDAA